MIHLTFEKVPGGRGGYNRWTINGKSWPDTNPLFTVQKGKRYRLVMDNHSGDEHPVHMHRHTFEVTKINDNPMSGLMKDTISMPRYSKAEIDFLADDPGPTFFHCHHQDRVLSFTDNWTELPEIPNKTRRKPLVAHAVM